MPDISLYTGEASPNDVRLRDPTAPAGPQVYEVSVAEVAAALDSDSAVAVFVASDDETCAAADTPTAVAVFAAADAETAGAAETPSAALVAAASLAEAATAADTLDAAAVFAATTAETATASEASSDTEFEFAAIVETAVAADTTTVGEISAGTVAELLAAIDAADSDVVAGGVTVPVEIVQFGGGGGGGGFSGSISSSRRHPDIGEVRRQLKRAREARTRTLQEQKAAAKQLRKALERAYHGLEEEAPEEAARLAEIVSPTLVKADLRKFLPPVPAMDWTAVAADLDRVSRLLNEMERQRVANEAWLADEDDVEMLLLAL